MSSPNPYTQGDVITTSALYFLLFEVASHNLLQLLNEKRANREKTRSVLKSCFCDAYILLICTAMCFIWLVRLFLLLTKNLG